jgi:hypothetical protein
MLQAFSRLKGLLNDKNMTVPELHRRLRGRGLRVNVKSLYRLSNDRRPLQRLDLRVAGAICQVFSLPLTELVAFAEPQRKLRRLAAAKQKRLDALMGKSNNGTLTNAEAAELRTLVREAEEIMLDNARQLAEQRQQLATP